MQEHFVDAFQILAGIEAIHRAQLASRRQLL